MASLNVFDTNELLEAILVCLPFEDIIITRGVSKSWNAMFDSSLQLKRATFRAPVGEILQLDVDDTKALYAEDDLIPPSHNGRVSRLLPRFNIIA